jgi:hypothetical protein
MSTPISRNNKLQGPALYAPPRVRERVFFQERAEIAETPPQYEDEQSATEQPEPTQSETEQPEMEELERDLTATVEEPDSGYEEDEGNEADDADALDWVDQAIRAVIEIEHASDGLATSGPRGAVPRSPSIAPATPAQDKSAPRAPPVSRTPRQVRDEARGVPLRRPRLEPELVPEPPVAMERSGAFPLFTRFSLVVIFAAIVAYGLTMLSSSRPGMPWFKGAGDRVAGIVQQSQQAQPPARSPSRLVVEDQQTFANEPLSLAVSIEHARDNELLLFDGLAQGTTLSAGSSTSPSSWRLPYDKLRGLYLYAPKDFVGVMNTAVNLLGADKRLLDSRTVQLKWVARAPEPVSPPALVTASAEATPGANVGTAKLATPGIEPIDPGEADMLMQKGRDFLTNGDISAARVAFRRLADAGIADAALELANTYDPDYLAAHNFLGVRGDPATARALYQRAKELGSAEADRILARMVGN